MKISGLQKTTLLDYPGHVAATIFLGGCNFRCPFCHNMDIVESSCASDKTGMDEEDVIKFLNKRLGILEGVCITGGEPTMYKELPNLIRKIKKIPNDSSVSDSRSEKELGYLVKLDTNGTNPGMLRELIRDSLIDYIAMDIKTSIDSYAEVAGLDLSNDAANRSEKLISNVKESIEIIMNSGIDYEFRTTVVSEYHDSQRMEKIGELIKGSRKYYLQSFNDSDYVPDHTLTSPEKETLLAYKDIVGKYVDFVDIRGVD